MATRIYPERYMEAAPQRLRDARRLQRNHSFVLGLYCAGVAAECVLRGFRTLDDAEFYEGHDFLELLRGCDQRRLGSDRQRFHAALNTLREIWNNDFRYHSHSLLRTRFFKRKMTRTFKERRIKGDPVAFYCRLAIEQASIIISIGERQWDS